MAKKMSIEEILAAARAGKGGDAKPAAPAPAEASEPAPAAEAPSGEAPAKPAAAKPVAAGGKGMSIADIMAAARAGKGASPAAPAPAAKKPAAEKPAAAAKPAAKAEKPAAAVAADSGPKDTASILNAARKGAKPGPISKAEAAAREGGAEAGKKKLEVPPMPAKPAYAQAVAKPATEERRGFLALTLALIASLGASNLAIGFTSLVVTNLMWGLGLARFMFPNVLIEPPTKFKVGFPDSFAFGQVDSRFIPQFGVWIVRYEYEGASGIYALKSVCTHLGCTPNWLEAEQKFKCPCHGSGFYKDGVNFEGPAPRPLERYAISVADDGQLLVDKSRTFNQELGQWKDPASFVSV
ncbi:MAG: ubiquinol-cytochrome c reductase iron-sulfur subunit [Planctomycetaceae bacterium]